MDPIEPPQVAPSRQDLLLGVRDQFLLAERPGNFFLLLATGNWSSCLCEILDGSEKEWVRMVWNGAEL